MFVRTYVYGSKSKYLIFMDNKCINAYIHNRSREKLAKFKFILSYCLDCELVPRDATLYRVFGHPNISISLILAFHQNMKLLFIQLSI